MDLAPRRIPSWNPAMSAGIRSANALSLVDSYLLLLLRAYTIGPMSTDQYKQIGIRGGARSHQWRGGFIKQNGNFEKLKELKGRSEKFNNP
jgi:hypothetical protein